ncbi:MAG TPA: hypothetical protein PK095_11705 [Myxococcota bacterium]|nr:hypothetical protein [Myxococcota bacterium]
MTDRGVLAGGSIATLLRALALVSALGACTDSNPARAPADTDADTIEADAEPDLSEDTSDGHDLDAVAPDVFRCTSDPDCVPVIGGVDQCERAACNTLTGQCVRTARIDGSPCSDRNACTAGDACRSARCIGLGVTDCDDDDPCTADRCEPREGCLHSPVDGSCDDEDLCTERDQCADGLCIGARIDCDDGDPCTLDRCDSELGCIYRAVEPCPASGDPG